MGEGETTIREQPTELERLRARVEEGRRHEALLQAVLQVCLDEVVLIRNGVVESIKPRPVISGLEASAIVGRSFLEFVAPEQRERVAAIHRARLSGEPVPSHYESRVTRQDGTTADIEVTVAHVDLGGPPTSVAILRDITERKRTERALQDSEERYRSLFELSPDTVVVSDLQGRIVMANREAARAFGCASVAELLSLGLNAFDLIRPDQRPRAQQNARATLDQSAVRNLEYVTVQRDGSTRPSEVNAAVVRDSEGRPTGYIGIVRDISARKEAEAARQELEQRLQQARRLESLGILAGGVAHDFNNLLQTVLCNVALAQQDLPADTPARRSVDEIGRTARLAADLVRQLLAFSGRGQLAPRPVDLADLVDEILELRRGSIPARIAVQYEPGVDVPVVEADPTQLRQVLLNLLANAAEAIGDAPGAITVRTGVLRADRALLARTCLPEELPEGPYVFLEVQDTGPGIDEAVRSRMFDPFFTTKPEGRGLGLAAVLGIVRGHRGAIDVESRPGEGCTVRVLLPVG